MSLLDAIVEAFDTVAIPAPRKEAWIAIRLDGAAGSGAARDPYNGSTQDLLDSLLRSGGLIAPNMTVHFGPGVFQTRGRGALEIGFTVLSGQRFVGAGIHQTVLQLVKATPPFGQGAGVAVFGSPAGIMDVEITDMTRDCNLSRQLKVGDGSALLAATGIGFSLGTRVRLKRVRIINWGTHTPFYVNGEQQPDNKTKECFPVFVVTEGGGVLGEAVLEDCIIEQPDLCQARESSLLLSRANTNSPQFFSTIRNNYLNGDYTTGAPPPAIEVTGISVITPGSGDLVQFVTKWPHRVQGGDEVYIAGAASNPNYNGRHVVEGAPQTDEFRTFCIKKGALGNIPTDAGITIQRYVPRAMPVYLTAAKAFVSGSWQVTVTVSTPYPHLRRRRGQTGRRRPKLYRDRHELNHFAQATESALPIAGRDLPHREPRRSAGEYLLGNKSPVGTPKSATIALHRWMRSQLQPAPSTHSTQPQVGI